MPRTLIGYHFLPTRYLEQVQANGLHPMRIDIGMPEGMPPIFGTWVWKDKIRKRDLLNIIIFSASLHWDTNVTKLRIRYTPQQRLDRMPGQGLEMEYPFKSNHFEIKAKTDIIKDWISPEMTEVDQTFNLMGVLRSDKTAY